MSIALLESLIKGIRDFVNIEKDLIKKCKKGDRAAQKQLYLHSKERLKAISLRYCISIQDAQDVVQSAYLKIFRSIKKFDFSKGGFEAWSAKIVVNEALMQLRKSKVFQASFVQNDNVVKVEAELNKLTLQEVEQVINLMTPTHKVMMNLYYFEEYSYKEIAQALRIKEPAARARMSRAKKAFNKIWHQFNQSTLHYEVNNS